MMQPKRRTKSEGVNPIQQFDEYLSILKRFGIPTSDSDTLEAVGPSPFILIFNTTLNKLRIYDGTIWKDAVPADLTNYYTKIEIDSLFTTQINGLKLEVNQLTSEVYLKDSEDNILSTINVGFLNNEGTSFVYNEIDNTLELYNDSEELLTSIPVSSFVTNSVSQIIFNTTTPTILEIKDVNNVVISSVQITISNIDGLQTALNNLEPLITILPVSKGGTGKNTITENSFYVGGPANTLTEKTIEEVFSMLISAGNGLDVDEPNNIYVISANSGRITVNPTGIDLAQVAVTPGTYYKVTVDEYGRVVGTSNVNINDFSAILNSIHNLTDNGFIVKNGTNTVSRIITGTSGRIVVSNQTGVDGNPQIDLSPVGVAPGTYNSVTVDDYGRVTAGTTVNILSTVLSGFSLLVGGPVIDTDTIIGAFSKIQNQINNLVTLNTTQTITGNKQFNDVGLIKKNNTAAYPTTSGGYYIMGGNSNNYDLFDFYSIDGNDSDGFGVSQIYSEPETGNEIRHTSLDNQQGSILRVNYGEIFLRHIYGGMQSSLYVNGITDKIVIEGTQNKFANLGTSLITGSKTFEFPNKNGTLALLSDIIESVENKVDKNTTAGVERVWVNGTDGIGAYKPTSDFKDVLEFVDFASFPTTGESEKIYIDLFYNLQYRWAGSVYVQIGGVKPQYDTYFQFLTTRQTLTATGTWKTWGISYTNASFWSTPENVDRGTGVDPAYNKLDYGIISHIEDNRFLDFLTWEEVYSDPYTKQIRVEKFDVLLAGSWNRINRRTVINETLIATTLIPSKQKLQATDSFDTPTGYNSIYVLYIKDMDAPQGLFSTRTITWKFKKL